MSSHHVLVGYRSAAAAKGQREGRELWKAQARQRTVQSVLAWISDLDTLLVELNDQSADGAALRQLAEVLQPIRARLNSAAMAEHIMAITRD
jgi:hypothetical protein